MPDPVPDISVVLATWQGDRHLREQLDSVLAQTLPPLEIVAVDDASTDGTLAILEAYAARDPRIRVFPSASNQGYVRNFVRGLALARGAFVAPCDQDDVWLPRKLEVLRSRIGDHPAVYSDSELVDEGLRPLGRRMSQVKRQVDVADPLMFAVGQGAPGHSMLVRRELVEACLPFPDVMPHDYWMAFQASGRGGLRYVPEPLVLYRQHGGNAIGLPGSARRRPRKRTRAERRERIRETMRTMAERCPPGHPESQAALRALARGYEGFSPAHGWLRMATVMRHRDLVFSHKHKSPAARVLSSLRMLFTID
ncbi:MAG TPA: glycosyltransferase family 2 protein [Anaeromyxobacteraceae bacterium]|nr:glycosyltransferase family 2 protein [Anaeromyxobacteraceae bacterium]